MAIVFYCFLPMCFFFVGTFLSQLQKENRELRSRIDELTSAPHDLQERGESEDIAT